jgi:hypothetical protein
MRQKQQFGKPLVVTMKRVIQASVAACLFVSVANAQTATYTFESTQFVLNSPSPFLNKPPDSGLNTFQASFTSSPNPTAFFVGGTQFPPTLTGKILMDGTGPAGGNTLRVSFNTPVNQVQFAFALFVPGHLNFTSSAGNSSANTPESSQVGSLAFQSAQPFSEFYLTGFGGNNNQVSLAIDNLVFTIVPEPSFACLILGALSAGILARRRSL